MSNKGEGDLPLQMETNMRLEAGKRYTRRDGSVTGPLKHSGRDDHYSFECDQCRPYSSNGVWDNQRLTDFDLISEYEGPESRHEGPELPHVEPNLDNNLDSDLDKDARIAELEDAAEELTRVKCVAESVNHTLRARVEELEDVETAYRVVLQDAKRIATERNTLRTQLLSKEKELAAVTAERDENAAHYGYWQNEAMKASEELAAYKQPRLVKQTWQNVYDRLTSYPEYDSRGAADYWTTGNGRCLGVLRRDTYQNHDGSTFMVAELEPVTEESK